jgi:transketolase
VTIFAAGSEVEIALKAKELLGAKGIAARVVSVPAFELFDQQSAEYQASVIGTSKVKIAVEAGVRQGWDQFIGNDGGFVGMKSFGASAPYKDLYNYFGITPEAVVALAEKKLA